MPPASWRKPAAARCESWADDVFACACDEGAISEEQRDQGLAALGKIEALLGIEHKSRPQPDHSDFIPIELHDAAIPRCRIDGCTSQPLIWIGDPDRWACEEHLHAVSPTPADRCSAE